MSARVAADLRAAADVLERDGWTRLDYGTPDGCKCIYGALHYVASGGTESYPTEDRPDHSERIETAARYVGAQVGVGHDIPAVRVVAWNDDKAKNATEVIAALRAAADRAEADQ